MARSLKKGIFSEVPMKQKDGIQDIWSRRSMVLPAHVHQEVQVHNGKTFHKIKVTQEMIGHKFGEFTPTRTYYGHAADKKAKRG